MVNLLLIRDITEGSTTAMANARQHFQRFRRSVTPQGAYFGSWGASTMAVVKLYRPVNGVTFQRDSSDLPGFATTGPIAAAIMPYPGPQSGGAHNNYNTHFGLWSV